LLKSSLIFPLEKSLVPNSEPAYRTVSNHWSW
jgi:hypothetical protein